MLLVILGAGASYDSVNPSLASAPFRDDEWVGTTAVGDQRSIAKFRPPLAVELFADRLVSAGALEAHPECAALVYRLRSLAASGVLQVEDELDAFSAQADAYPDRRRQLTALRFYLHKVITACGDNWQRLAKGITNYTALVDELALWQSTTNDRAVVVTFNYDTLLEDAWTRRGDPPMSLEWYLEHRVVKVHGSVDWQRMIPRAAIHGVSSEIVPAEVLTRKRWLSAQEIGALAAVSAMQIEGPLSRVGDLLPEDSVVGTLPALAVPIRSKHHFECPDEHLQALRSWLAQVDRVLVIGWAGADDHFLKFAAESGLTTRRALIVAGNEKAADAPLEAMWNAGVLKSANGVTVSRGGFSALLTNNRADLETLLRG